MSNGANHHEDLFGSDATPEPGGLVVLVWAIAAAVMLVIVVVALQYGTPERNRDTSAVVHDTNVPAPAPDEAADTVAAMSVQTRGDPAGGSVAMLRDEIFDLRQEIVAMRHTVDSLREQNDALVLRLDALEKDDFEEITGSIDRSQFAPPSPPAPAQQDTRRNIDAAARDKAIETRFGLELGTFPDLTALRSRWRALQSENPTVFAGLDAVASVRDRDGRMELLLVAGPYRNAASAADACGTVEARGIACAPAFFLGQPLELR
ncbi:hypothetical protein [Methylobrevis pamukkalensis]|uniref:SPOR domain-containing protein n=1 Tax=Methylobrevis pamukkalensis TaxID=1439726 RepID=A0A1E3H279_9HYPH|nr:hypothetical protein [Methylobrevis pamukkalensis]ODN70433.1 hypothetical protein A6302_02236 [Methylobrevis pamukkalensis]